MKDYIHWGIPTYEGWILSPYKNFLAVCFFLKKGSFSHSFPTISSSFPSNLIWILSQGKQVHRDANFGWIIQQIDELTCPRNESKPSKMTLKLTMVEAKIPLRLPLWSKTGCTNRWATQVATWWSEHWWKRQKSKFLSKGVDAKSYDRRTYRHIDRVGKKRHFKSKQGQSSHECVRPFRMLVFVNLLYGRQRK